MPNRVLKIPSLGFDVVVMSASDKTNALIGEMLEKKLVTELAEEEYEPVWGKEEGYCAWCVDSKALDQVWEYGVDSQGDHVKYACCKQCATDRGVEGVR
jgi:hypothetical protein